MKNKIIKVSEFILYWSIILLPFSMALGSAPLNIVCALLLAAFVIKSILKKEKLFTDTDITLPFLLFFIVSCVSLVNSVNYSDSIKGLFKLLRYMLIFIAAASHLKDKNHLKKIIISISLGGILVSLDAIWQVWTGEDFMRGNFLVINLGLKRVTASFSDSNVFGIYLSAIAPLVFGLGLYYLRGVRKLLFGFFSLLILAAIALTYSRPTLLAVYAALFLFSILKKDRVLLTLLIILALLSPVLMPKAVKDWARQVNYNPLRFMCNDDRIAIYRNSINMIKEHPVIGVGVNTFMKNYKEYKESPEYLNIVTSDYVYAHNNFLHTAGEVGLLGLGVFLWLLYRILRGISAINKKLEDDFLSVVSVSLFACLIAFLVNGLTESSFFYSRVSVIFWYLAGLAFALRDERLSNYIMTS